MVGKTFSTELDPSLPPTSFRSVSNQVCGHSLEAERQICVSPRQARTNEPGLKNKCGFLFCFEIFLEYLPKRGEWDLWPPFPNFSS